MGNTQVFKHRLPALFAATLSTASFVLAWIGGSSCSFLTVHLEDSHSPESSVVSDAPQISSTDNILPSDFSLGLLCGSPYIDHRDDGMARVSRGFLISALIVGGMYTILAWCLGTCVAPARDTWWSLSIFSATTAVLQVPAFLLFESSPCSTIGWSCHVSSGCFALIASTALHASVTILTQYVDPPAWAAILDTWRVEKRRVKVKKHVHHDEERAMNVPQEFLDEWGEDENNNFFYNGADGVHPDDAAFDSGHGFVATLRRPWRWMRGMNGYLRANQRDEDRSNLMTTATDDHHPPGWSNEGDEELGQQKQQSDPDKMDSEGGNSSARSLSGGLRGMVVSIDGVSARDLVVKRMDTAAPNHTHNNPAASAMMVLRGDSENTLTTTTEGPTAAALSIFHLPMPDDCNNRSIMPDIDGQSDTTFGSLDDHVHMAEQERHRLTHHPNQPQSREEEKIEETSSDHAVAWEPDQYLVPLPRYNARPPTPTSWNPNTTKGTQDHHDDDDDIPPPPPLPTPDSAPSDHAIFSSSIMHHSNRNILDNPLFGLGDALYGRRKENEDEDSGAVSDKPPTFENYQYYADPPPSSSEGSSRDHLLRSTELQRYQCGTLGGDLDSDDEAARAAPKHSVAALEEVIPLDSDEMTPKEKTTKKARAGSPSDNRTGLAKTVTSPLTAALVGGWSTLRNLRLRQSEKTANALPTTTKPPIRNSRSVPYANVGSSNVQDNMNNDDNGTNGNGDGAYESSGSAVETRREVDEAWLVEEDRSSFATTTTEEDDDVRVRGRGLRRKQGLRILTTHVPHPSSAVPPNLLPPRPDSEDEEDENDDPNSSTSIPLEDPYDTPSSLSESSAVSAKSPPRKIVDTKIDDPMVETSSEEEEELLSSEDQNDEEEEDAMLLAELAALDTTTSSKNSAKGTNKRKKRRRKKKKRKSLTSGTTSGSISSKKSLLELIINEETDEEVNMEAGSSSEEFEDESPPRQFFQGQMSRKNGDHENDRDDEALNLPEDELVAGAGLGHGRIGSPLPLVVESPSGSSGSSNAQGMPTPKALKKMLDPILRSSPEKQRSPKAPPSPLLAKSQEDICAKDDTNSGYEDGYLSHNSSIDGGSTSGTSSSQAFPTQERGLKMMPIFMSKSRSYEPFADHTCSSDADDELIIAETRKSHGQDTLVLSTPSTAVETPIPTTTSGSAGSSDRLTDERESESGGVSPQSSSSPFGARRAFSSSPIPHLPNNVGTPGPSYVLRSPGGSMSPPLINNTRRLSRTRRSGSLPSPRSHRKDQIEPDRPPMSPMVSVTMRSWREERLWPPQQAGIHESGARLLYGDDIRSSSLNAAATVVENDDSSFTKQVDHPEDEFEVNANHTGELNNHYTVKCSPSARARTARIRRVQTHIRQRRERSATRRSRTLDPPVARKRSTVTNNGIYGCYGSDDASV